jgi:electron transfer flavoprotein alpha subunit
VHVLVAGYNAKAVADAAAKLDGVEKVLLADDAAYEHRLAEPLAALLVSLAGPYDALVAPGTTNGKNVMPRVAALLDVMQVSEVTKVVAADTFERPIYAGNAIQTVQSQDAKKVLTIRGASFAAAGDGSTTAPVETVAAAGNAGLSTFKGQDHHLGRPRFGLLGELHQGDRARRRPAGRGHGRLARGGRCRLRSERLAGRPDRQGRGA